MSSIRDKSRVAVLLVALDIATNVALIALVAHSNEKERAAQSANISELAAATARVIGLRLHSLSKEARILASEAATAPDMAHLGEALQTAAAASGHHYILGDQAATQLINTAAPRGVDRAVAREPHELKEIFAGKEMIVTEPRESRFVGEWREGKFHGDFLFGVRVPVTVNGEIRYVLTLLAPRGVIGTVLKESYRPAGWKAAVLDQKGRLVARVPEHGHLLGRRAPPEAIDIPQSVPLALIETTDLEGWPSLAAVANVPNAPWRVAVWVPHQLLADGRSPNAIWFSFANLLLLFGLLIVLGNRQQS